MKKGINKRWDKNSKIVYLNLTVLVVTLNINDLNNLIKKQIFRLARKAILKYIVLRNFEYEDID